jgi:type VI secretion system lysozyme-like protein
MANTIPLFEKLIDNDPEVLFEKVPKQLANLAELEDLIRLDLSRLLNTRISIFWKNYSSKIAIPFAYGVNITAPASAENVFEIQEIEAHVDEIIKQFEPRLIGARSHVINLGKDPSSLFMNIEATIEIENRRTPLSFPVVIDT